jgi:hypothetical protein
MKNQVSVSMKTLAIKARVLNKFRKLFYKEQLKNFPDTLKIEIFNQLFSEVRAAHNELVEYKSKRKYRAEIEAKRVARGYKAKKKTSLAEYEDRMRDAVMSKAS